MHTNVDPAEVAKFEALASRWWDPASEFKPLHEINPLRANYIDSCSPVAEQTLLDVGCGGGLLTEAMAQRGALVTGIDMGATPLSVARLHALESNLEIHYLQQSAEQHAVEKAEAGSTYDIVTCLEMLEHVPDPSSVIRSCAQLVKPGGNLYFSTINRNPKSYAFAILGAEYLLRLLPKGTHEYQKFIRPSELAQWLREAGLELQSMVGICYQPFTKQYRIDPNDVSVNYLVHATKPLDSRSSN